MMFGLESTVLLHTILLSKQRSKYSRLVSSLDAFKRFSRSR